MAKRFFLAMLIALTFGATAAADPALNGRWFDADSELRFSDGNWEVWFNGSPMARGTYTVFGGAITMITNYYYGDFLNDFVLPPPSLILIQGGIRRMS